MSFKRFITVKKVLMMKRSFFDKKHCYDILDNILIGGYSKDKRVKLTLNGADLWLIKCQACF